MRNKSIRFKLTLWFFLVLAITVGLAFLAVRVSSGVVLHGTIREYLLSTVEENMDKISYVEKKPDKTDSTINTNIYIKFGEGFLAIDDDFLDVVNDVYAALYTKDGTLIYGENPLEKKTSALSFTESYLWHIEFEGESYEIYDRILNINLPEGEELWIRGVVPETESVRQLHEITRLSLILLPLLLLLAAFTGYLLIDKYLRPIGEIEKTANRISQGEDLKQRINIEQGDDEVGKMAKVFNRMFDRLEQSFETERQFTSDASHELRTPTSVILAQTEYTLEKDRSPEEYKEALEVVQKQSQRMNTLIGDMLDYTRMEQSPDRYPMEDVELSSLAEEVSYQMSMVGEKDIKLVTNIQPDIHIKGNVMLLARMLQNLIGNSYRYGVEEGKIEVLLEEQESEILLTVKDNGIGISQEDQEKIFDRFYRGDASRTRQGTGLGLAMVKRIVEHHKASIQVQSIEGMGSVFTIHFPKEDKKDEK